jgi:hypothetical protein
VQHIWPLRKVSLLHACSNLTSQPTVDVKPGRISLETPCTLKWNWACWCTVCSVGCVFSKYPAWISVVLPAVTRMFCVIDFIISGRILGQYPKTTNNKCYFNSNPEIVERHWNCTQNLTQVCNCLAVACCHIISQVMGEGSGAQKCFTNV